MNKLKWLLLVFPVCLVLWSFSWQSNDLKDIYSRAWVTQSYGDPAFTLQSPEALQTVTIDIPDQVRQFVVKMGTYQYQHDALLIMASSVSYKPEVVASLQGAANGSVNEMKNRPGITDFIYTEKSETISGQEAIIQTGSFNAGEDALDFHNIITVKGADLWQVFVAYKKGDPFGLKTKDKILKSIKI